MEDKITYYINNSSNEERRVLKEEFTYYTQDMEPSELAIYHENNFLQDFWSYQVLRNKSWKYLTSKETKLIITKELKNCHSTALTLDSKAVHALNYVIEQLGYKPDVISISGIKLADYVYQAIQSYEAHKMTHANDKATKARTWNKFWIAINAYWRLKNGN